MANQQQTQKTPKAKAWKWPITKSVEKAKTKATKELAKSLKIDKRILTRGAIVFHTGHNVVAKFEQLKVVVSTSEGWATIKHPDGSFADVWARNLRLATPAEVKKYTKAVRDIRRSEKAMQKQETVKEFAFKDKEAPKIVCKDPKGIELKPGMFVSNVVNDTVLIGQILKVKSDSEIRVEVQGFWTNDTWRVVDCTEEYRPFAFSPDDKVYHRVHGSGTVQDLAESGGYGKSLRVTFRDDKGVIFTEDQFRELRVVRRGRIERKKERLFHLNEAQELQRVTQEGPAWPFPTQPKPLELNPAPKVKSQPKKAAFETVGIWRAFYHKDKLFVKVSKSNAISIMLASDSFVPAAILLDHAAPTTGKELIQRFKKADKVVLYTGEVL